MVIVSLISRVGGPDTGRYDPQAPYAVTVTLTVNIIKPLQDLPGRPSRMRRISPVPQRLALTGTLSTRILLYA